MRRVSDHRCPACRAPREGVTAAQAEPPPDRNVDSGLALQEFQRLHAQGGGNGGNAERMFFAVQPPISLSLAQHLASAGVPVERDADALLARTLQLDDLGIPPDLVDALLDVPSVNLSEWAARRRAARTSFVATLARVPRS